MVLIRHQHRSSAAAVSAIGWLGEAEEFVLVEGESSVGVFVI